jgi:hypothetical protein
MKIISMDTPLLPHEVLSCLTLSSSESMSDFEKEKVVLHDQVYKYLAKNADFSKTKHEKLVDLGLPDDRICSLMYNKRLISSRIGDTYVKLICKDIALDDETVLKIVKIISEEQEEDEEGAAKKTKTEED